MTFLESPDHSIHIEDHEVEALYRELPGLIEEDLRRDKGFLYLMGLVLQDHGGFLSFPELIEVIRAFLKREDLPYMSHLYGILSNIDPNTLNTLNLEEFATTLVAAHTNYALKLHRQNKSYDLRPGYSKELHDFEVRRKGF